MRLTLTAIIISFTSICFGQSDSSQAERFFTDSLGGQYIVEYRYAPGGTYLRVNEPENIGTHGHFIAICSIIKWKGNKSQIVMQNIKAIYSPTECSSDNSKLWLKRLYEYQNKKR